MRESVGQVNNYVQIKEIETELDRIEGIAKIEDFERFEELLIQINTVRAHLDKTPRSKEDMEEIYCALDEIESLLGVDDSGR